MTGSIIPKSWPAMIYNHPPCYSFMFSNHNVKNTRCFSPFQHYDVHILLANSQQIYQYNGSRATTSFLVKSRPLAPTFKKLIPDILYSILLQALGYIYVFVNIINRCSTQINGFKRRFLIING